MVNSEYTCSHDGCQKGLPKGTKNIPEGWTHALVENYGAKSVTYYHIYLCPLHVLGTEDAQPSLFRDSP